MLEWAPVFSAAAVGFLGSGHCLGMCGGIVSAMSFGVRSENPWQRITLVAGYNLGRLLTYGLLGALAGWLTLAALPSESFWHWPRLLSGLFMILLGMHLAGWSRILGLLERIGTPLWRHIGKLARRLLPIDSLSKALLCGMAWGFLPCGLVYSALALSASEAAPLTSGLSMLAFGAGTLPAMLLAGHSAAQLKQWIAKRSVRTTAGGLIMLFGLWTIIFGLPGHSHHHHPASLQIPPVPTPKIQSAVGPAPTPAPMDNMEDMPDMDMHGHHHSP